MGDFNKAFSSLLHAGEQHAESTTEKRKIHHSNIVAGIAVLTATLYGLFYLLSDTGNIVFTNSATIQLTFAPVYLLTMVLNHRGYLRLARWMMSVNALGMICLLVVFGQGNDLNAHFFFLSYCGIIISTFPVQQWRSIIFLSALNILLFVACESGSFPPYPEVEELDQNIVAFLEIANILSSTFLMVGIILLSDYATSKNEIQLETISTTDSLTGMLNRRGFMQRFELERARCFRSRTCGTLLFIDLDNFKTVNDQYGHDAGDSLLQQAAQIIEISLRETDVVARFGGDEFVALIAEVDADEKKSIRIARSIATKIESALQTSCSLTQEMGNSQQTFKYRCSASIGVTPFDGESDLKQVIKMADQAMYRQKTQAAELDVIAP